MLFAVTGAVLATVVLTLTACTTQVKPGPAQPHPQSTSSAGYVLSVFRDGVRRHSPAGAAAVLHTGDHLAKGDSLSSDSTGFAQLSIADGSALRFGADTRLRLGSLSADHVAVTLNAGGIWQAGTSESGAPTVRVTTPAGVVTATGATFSLLCAVAGSCDLAVVDGTVEVAPTKRTPVTVAAYQRLLFSSSADPAPPVIYPVSGMHHDEWMATNLALDGDRAAPVRTDQSAVIAAASLAGTWKIDTVVTQSDNPSQPPGTATHRDWEFGPANCGNACSMDLTRTFGRIGSEATEKITETLTYTAAGFRAYRAYTQDCATADGTVLAAGYFANTSTYELHVAAVELRSGAPIATRLEGTAISTVDFAGAPYADGCALNTLTPVVQSVVGVLDTPVVLPALAAPPSVLPAPKADPIAADVVRTALSDSVEAPSVLSSLRTVADLDLTAVRLGATLVLTLILLLIVGYPAHLLNATISENYDRIVARAKPVMAGWARVRARFRVRPSRRVATGAGIAAAAVIAAFVDPGFGLNPASGRVVLSMALSFVVDSLCAWLLIAAIVRRTQHGSTPAVRFRYGSLAIVLAAVLFSRLTGFEPGMVFGTVVGLTLGVTLAKAGAAHVTLWGLGYAAGVSLASWLLFSLLVPVFGDQPGLLGVFTLESLSAFAIGGFAALPIALLPMKALDGGTLFSWKRSVWAVAYGSGMFVFLLILLPLPSSWGTVTTPFPTWLALYIGFGVFAVLVWGYFRLRRPATEPTAGSAPPIVQAPSSSTSPVSS
ncbi:MAG: FecR family protein [Terrimesophilobacter sp.]